MPTRYAKCTGVLRSLSKPQHSSCLLDLSLTPEPDTRKFEIPGLLVSSVELLRCQVIQR